MYRFSLGLMISAWERSISLWRFWRLPVAISLMALESSTARADAGAYPESRRRRAAGYFAAFFLRAAQEAFIRSDTASFSLAVIGRRFPRRCGVGRGLRDRGGRAAAGRRAEERRAAGFRRSGGPEDLVDVVQRLDFRLQALDLTLPGGDCLCYNTHGFFFRGCIVNRSTRPARPSAVHGCGFLAQRGLAGQTEPVPLPTLAGSGVGPRPDPGSRGGRDSRVRPCRSERAEACCAANTRGRYGAGWNLGSPAGGSEEVLPGLPRRRAEPGRGTDGPGARGLPADSPAIRGRRQARPFRATDLGRPRWRGRARRVQPGCPRESLRRPTSTPSTSSCSGVAFASSKAAPEVRFDPLLRRSPGGRGCRGQAEGRAGGGVQQEAPDDVPDGWRRRGAPWWLRLASRRMPGRSSQVNPPSAKLADELLRSPDGPSLFVRA